MLNEFCFPIACFREDLLQEGVELTDGSVYWNEIPVEVTKSAQCILNKNATGTVSCSSDAKWLLDDKMKDCYLPEG